MAARRSRIKGIASIPQRRKPVAESVIPKLEEEPTFDKIASESNIKNGDMQSDACAANDNEPSCSGQALLQVVKLKASEPVNDEVEAKLSNSLKAQPAFSRRRFLKPTVSLKTISKSNAAASTPTAVVNEEVTSPDYQEPGTPESAVQIKSNDINSKHQVETDISVLGITKLPVETVPIECASPPKNKTEFNTVIHRKCRRTEQSRKLAEARKDFQNKFNNGKPDRQKLTMIDLIFYNPSTSPMSQKRKHKDTETGTIQIGPDEEEQEVDTPTDVAGTVRDADHSDEENTVPAPQITIGADGEIVIDEKSLFIESKDVKRSRETLKNSVLVDGDDAETGYGLYNRVKRSKDWSKMETLRFYKALNTLGTDFTLMCGLFPGRSRRELKMKFKKEERVNRALVDRAVTQPIQFDLTDLQRDLEKQEIETLRLEALKKDRLESQQERKLAKEKQSVGGRIVGRPRAKRKSATAAKGVEDEQKSFRRKLRSRLHQGISSLVESDDDNDAAAPANHAESVIANNNDVSMVDESNRNNDPVDQNVVEEKLEQGSIVVSSNVNQNGEEEYKVYSVNQNGEKIRIEISPDVLRMLINAQKDIGELPSKEVAVGNSEKINALTNLPVTTDCIILPFEDGDISSGTPNDVPSVAPSGL